MAYTEVNFKSKKELKAAVKDYLESGGPSVTYYDPSGLREPPKDGFVYIEGPHYPKPHKFYAECYAENGRIVKVVK